MLNQLPWSEVRSARIGGVEPIPTVPPAGTDGITKWAPAVSSVGVAGFDGSNVRSRSTPPARSSSTATSKASALPTFSTAIVHVSPVPTSTRSSSTDLVILSDGVSGLMSARATRERPCQMIVGNVAGAAPITSVALKKAWARLISGSDPATPAATYSPAAGLPSPSKVTSTCAGNVSVQVLAVDPPVTSPKNHPIFCDPSGIAVSGISTPVNSTPAPPHPESQVTATGPTYEIPSGSVSTTRRSFMSTAFAGILTSTE